MRILKVLTLVFVALISACGGGGSSSSESTTSELTFGPVSPGKISLTLPKGQTNQLVLSAPYKGTAVGTLFVVIEDPDQLIGGPSVQVYADSAALNLSISADAPVGRYTQPIVVRVCKDAGCKSQYAGSPQTIDKDIVIVGSKLDRTAMSFASTTGLAPASQSVAVTVPAGATFYIDQGSPVEYTDTDGSTSARSINDVLTITKSSAGFEVQPKAVAAGRYVIALEVDTPGFGSDVIAIEYEVVAGKPAFKVLTPAVEATAKVASAKDVFVYVEIVNRFRTAEREFFVEGLPAPDETGWVRYSGEDGYFTHGSGPAKNGVRYRFTLNACGLTGSDCLPAGTYRGSIILYGLAFDEEWRSDVVTVTFTISP